jgi:23S rRNA (pseudouridine1915-N3)-methyltransferase
MLKIKFIVVDRTRSPFLKEGEDYYLKKMRRYTQLEWVEVKPVKIGKNRSTAEILDLEAGSISQKMTKSDYKIAMDRKGNQLDSLGLAEWMQNLAINTQGWVCFIIGSPVGLSGKITDSADSMLSLSKLTLTHEMSRLILLEQLYRAFTIIKGEKYHK